jgi:hypothetical protein
VLEIAKRVAVRAAIPSQLIRAKVAVQQSLRFESKACEHRELIDYFLKVFFLNKNEMK